MSHERLGGAIVPVEQRGLLKKEKILKDQIGVLPIWFGRRLLDDSDYEAFQAALPYGAFRLYSQFVFTDAGEIAGESDVRPYLTPIASDLAGESDKIRSPLAVFIVTTPRIAESSWFKEFPQRLQQYRKTQNKRNDTFVYQIIMGGMGFAHFEAKDPSGRFWDNEVIAYELGAAYLRFNLDAPTAGCTRLVEFMSRILGKDLPGREFPNYTKEEIQKIAWNINREDFNAWSPREGSIPKYPIGKNGRPVFPF